MTHTEKIARGLNIIEKKVFNDILDTGNYGVFTDTKIECLDENVDSDSSILDYEITLTLNYDKVIDFVLRIDVDSENMKINTYEDCFDEFTEFDYTVGTFWRVLFYNALDI